MNLQIEPLQDGEITDFFEWRGGGTGHFALDSTLKDEIGGFQAGAVWIFIAKIDDIWAGTAQLALFHEDPQMADGKTRICLRAVEVKTQFRGQGIATRLTDHALKIARSRGFVEVTLMVEPENKIAWHIYEKMGFETFKNAILRWDERDWSVVCQRKRLA